MEASHRSPASSHNLFEVYLRLRPPPMTATSTDRILTVEPQEANHDDDQEEANALTSSHIILNPPTDRRRAIEKFAFTRVFEEHASQLDVFHSADILPLVEGVLAPNGGEGTDAMVATLGVTGSGKVRSLFPFGRFVWSLTQRISTDSYHTGLQDAARHNPTCP